MKARIVIIEADGTSEEIDQILGEVAEKLLTKGTVAINEDGPCLPTSSPPKTSSSTASKSGVKPVTAIGTHACNARDADTAAERAEELNRLTSNLSTIIVQCKRSVFIDSRKGGSTHGRVVGGAQSEALRDDKTALEGASSAAVGRTNPVGFADET